MNGPNADILDHILEQSAPSSVAAAKRSRPSSISSLDYKVRNTSKRDKLTTTKPVKRKAPPQQQPPPDQQQKQQQQQQQQQHQYLNRRSISTRARGSSGPPPRKYDLSDLEGMNEEQILQALYEDPELAAAAAKAAEKARKDRGPSSKPSTGGERYYRASDGTVKAVGEYPEYLREMMDGGIPVKQWIILLVLLGAGLYQLRKAIVGPAKHTSPSPPKGKSSEKGKSKGKNHKKVATRGSTSDVDKVAKEIEGNVDATLVTPRSMPAIPIKKVSPSKGTTPKAASASPSPPPEPVTSKKETGQKKKKKSKVVASGSKKEETQNATSPTLFDEPSITRNEEGDRDTVATNATTAPIHEETATEDNNNGWQTVSKPRSTHVPEPETSPPPERVAEERPKKVKAMADSDQPKKSTESEMTTPELKEEKAAGEQVPNEEPINGSSAKHEVESWDQQEAQTKSNKKNKKKKSKSEPVENKRVANGSNGAVTNSEPEPEPASTEDDAKLALMLQKQEENFAKAEVAAAEQEEIWEEVATKKKKAT